MEEWVERLRAGEPEIAWDLLLTRYRKVIFAGIRHYVQDYDDVMDVFARVCEALREDEMRRLRRYAARAEHSARFSTWLVTVVRHLAVDWLRRRDGRERLAVIAKDLPALEQQIFEHVFLDQQSHVEAYETIRARAAPDLSFGDFLVALRATYHSVTKSRRGTMLRELGEVPHLEQAADESRLQERREQREWIERALDSLDPEDRVVVELYVVEELPAGEVARMLGLPNAKAVYNQVYRALEQARAFLAEAGLVWEDL